MVTRSMITRRSLRNLQAASQIDCNPQNTPQAASQIYSYSKTTPQVAVQTQNNDNVNLADGDPCRDYELNYWRAMRKKAKACQTAYLVNSEIKGENHIFDFSASMYELYRKYYD